MATVALTRSEEAELLALELAEEAAQIRKSFPRFVRDSWHVIEPSTKFLDNYHIDAMGEHLLAVRMGQITRLICNLPPRYMKSIIGSIDFAPWWWAEDPSRRFMFATFVDSLCKEHSLKRRDIIQSSWYQERFGGRCVKCEVADEVCIHRVIMSPDQNEKREFRNTAGGTMLAFPFGGSPTGRGANCIVIDDPLDPTGAISEVERKAAVEFIRGTLVTRLNDKKRDAMVMIMQRVHEKDPTGEMLADGDWVHLKLPAIAPKDGQSISLPISGKVITRKEGDLLWPEREGEKELAIMRRVMTDVRFAGQYLQEPAPPTGAFFQRTWWQYADALPPKFDFILDSWDCAFKDLETSDWVVGTKWGVKGRSIYLLSIVRRKMGFAETCLAVKGMRSFGGFHANQIIVEDKANGTAVVEVMRRAEWNVEAVQPEGGKVSRACAAQPTVKAGCVFLPSRDLCVALGMTPEDIDAFVEECARFTGKEGETDDQVDSMTQAIIFIVLQAGGIYAWMEQKIAEEQGKVQREAQTDVEKAQVAHHSWSKTIEALKQGAQIQCNKDQYINGLRAELAKFVAHCVEIENTGWMQITMSEMKKLDALFKVSA